MDASFGPETQVLWYGPRAHANPGQRQDRVYLLWPAWAHRVMAPEVRDRPLNPLALAILRLLAASRLTARELAHRLGVHPELAAFVVADLHGSGYLDDDYALASRGRELLENERDADARLEPGWVFRDPWRESLWPFVARELAPAATSIGERGYPELNLGTTGKPWMQLAFMQRPPRDAASKAPEAREILRAASEQRRIARRLARTDRHRFWDEDGPEPFDPKRVDLKRVAAIEPQAHPVFLATFLYVPQDGADREMDWHVCDFFGRADSLDLRRLLIEVADGQPHLASQLDRAIGRTLIGTDFAGLKERDRQRRAQAQLLLDKALTLDIRRQSVHEPLARLLDAWLELRELDAFADARRCDNVLRECRTVLEAVFAGLRERYPLAGVAKGLARDNETRAAYYRAAASAVGFARLPGPLQKIPPNQIAAVADYADAWRLRPLVMATVLGAREEAKHPLRAAAAERPDLLERIERVAGLAGGASHHGSDRAANRGELESAVDDTLRIVGSLLGLSFTSLAEIA
jgi:hypothetical protein